MANEKRLIYAGDLWHKTFVCEEPGDFRKAIENAPSVDAVEVVHGRWLPDMEEFDDDPAVGIRGGVYQTGWKCSICGRSEQAKEPFCNCGAKMDGKARQWCEIAENIESCEDCGFCAMLERKNNG